MKWRVDFYYVDGKVESGQRKVPMFEMENGIVRCLNTYSKEIATVGICVQYGKLLFPKDGMALQISRSGSYCHASAPYVVEDKEGKK